MDSTRRRASPSKWASLEPTQKRRFVAIPGLANCSPRASVTVCAVLAPALVVCLFIAHTQGVFEHVTSSRSAGQSHAAESQASLSQTQPTCGTPRPPPSKLPLWVPKRDRYLLSWCHLYGYSDKLYCTERALVLAAFLNRTLIVPAVDICVNSTKGNTMDLMVDVEHIRGCLLNGALAKKGAKLPQVPAGGFNDSKAQLEHLTAQDKIASEFLGSGLYALTLQEYLTLNKLEKLHVDVFLCERVSDAPHNPCSHWACKAAGLVANPRPTVAGFSLFSGTSHLSQKTLQRISNATREAGVLSLGDTFYAHVEGYRFAEGAPLAPMFDTPCGLLFQPTQEVFHRASAFIRNQLHDSPYASLHHPDGAGSQGYRVEDSAACLAAEMGEGRASKLVIASEGRWHGFETLRRTLERKGIDSMYSPSGGGLRSWLEQSLVEQVISAQASLFLSSQRSTYSLGVLQMRLGFGKDSCSAKPICVGKDQTSQK